MLKTVFYSKDWQHRIPLAPCRRPQWLFKRSTTVVQPRFGKPNLLGSHPGLNVSVLDEIKAKKDHFRILNVVSHTNIQQLIMETRISSFRLPGTSAPCATAMQMITCNHNCTPLANELRDQVPSAVTPIPTAQINTEIYFPYFTFFFLCLKCAT